MSALKPFSATKNSAEQTDVNADTEFVFKTLFLYPHILNLHHHFVERYICWQEVDKTCWFPHRVKVSVSICKLYFSANCLGEAGTSTAPGSIFRSTESHGKDIFQPIELPETVQCNSWPRFCECHLCWGGECFGDATFFESFLLL